LHDLIEEIATGDLYDLAGTLCAPVRSHALAFAASVRARPWREPRPRSGHGRSAKSLRQGGLEISAAELPDFVPLFLEFLATQPKTRAYELLGQPVHIFSAVAERLRKRQSPYESVFRALTALASVKPKDEEVSALLALPDPDPLDLAALDAAWEDEAVRFGPGAADSCKDDIATSLRAARRPAPDMPAQEPKRPIITTLRPTAPEETAMRELVNYLLFGWYPYVCITVLILGSICASTASNIRGVRNRASSSAAANDVGFESVPRRRADLLVGHFIGC
jgi:nitrate reductase molybdenum cofactor assembly chaperone NarJ/NarW